MAAHHRGDVAAPQVGALQQRHQGAAGERVLVLRRNAQLMGASPEVSDVPFDGAGIAGHRGGAECSERRQRGRIQADPGRPGIRRRPSRFEDPRRELRGHADHEQIEIRGRFEEHMILPGGPPEQLAAGHSDGQVADAEQRCSGRDQVQLGLAVKMARPTRLGNVVPDVSSRGAREGKRLVQHLRHASMLPSDEGRHTPQNGWPVSRRVPRRLQSSRRP